MLLIKTELNKHISQTYTLLFPVSRRFGGDTRRCSKGDPDKGPAAPHTRRLPRPSGGAPGPWAGRRRPRAIFLGGGEASNGDEGPGMNGCNLLVVRHTAARPASWPDPPHEAPPRASGPEFPSRPRRSSPHGPAARLSPLTPRAESPQG